MTASPFFSGFDQVKLAGGYASGKAPLFFRDMCLMGAIYTADMKAVKKLLPAKTLRPIRVSPGKALIAVHCIEYLKSDIGAYNEVSLSIAVQYGSLPLPSATSLLTSALMDNYHAYVTELPVSTERSVKGGVEHFNYPKYLADISFRETATHRVCTLRDKETLDLILEMECRKIRTSKRQQHNDPMRLKTISINTYPVKNDHVLNARMLLNPHEQGTSFLPNQAVLRLGEGERADAFRQLKPGMQIQYIYAPKCEGILFMPVKV